MSKRKILILSIVFSLSLIGIGIASFTVVAQEYQVTITDVVDGDTMDIQFQNGSTDTIRLIGVDTPEVYTSTDPQEFEGIPDNSDGRSWLSLWGDKASTYAKNQIANKQVTIEFDGNSDSRGSFGRLLVYVENGGDVFNLDLIEKGYARVYESGFTEQTKYLNSEGIAQNNNIGVWGYGSSSNTQGGLTVEDIHADASGNDHNNLNDEYIVFRNFLDRQLDISGWTVSDSAGHQHTFSSFSVGSGSTFTLHTGSGANSNSDRYWDSGSAIWNNGGDRIIVHNDIGTEVLNISYGDGGSFSLDPPTASFNFNPQNPNVGVNVSFDASSSSDSDGFISQYKWSFGDGTQARGETIKHTYRGGGQYSVSLSVVDNSGQIDTTTKTIDIESQNIPPIANFTFTPQVPGVGQQITFDGSGSMDPDGSIVEYRWDFDGDGNIEVISMDPTVTHSYPNDGSYTVELSVLDNDGASNTTEKKVNVFDIYWDDTITDEEMGRAITCYITGIDCKDDRLTDSEMGSLILEYVLQ